MTVLPWRYDARGRTARPELCPVFIPPPPRPVEDVEDVEDVDLANVPLSETASMDGPYMNAIRLGPPRGRL